MTNLSDQSDINPNQDLVNQVDSTYTEHGYTITDKFIPDPNPTINSLTPTPHPPIFSPSSNGICPFALPENKLRTIASHIHPDCDAKTSIDAANTNANGTGCNETNSSNAPYKKRSVIELAKAVSSSLDELNGTNIKMNANGVSWRASLPKINVRTTGKIKDTNRVSSIGSSIPVTEDKHINMDETASIASLSVPVLKQLPIMSNSNSTSKVITSSPHSFNSSKIDRKLDSYLLTCSLSWNMRVFLWVFTVFAVLGASIYATIRASSVSQQYLTSYSILDNQSSVHDI